MKKRKLTLEIGSGNNPRSGADILVDRYLFDNSQRAGAFGAVIDRPFVVADGYHLPFKDKSFDFVYCSHVLEHVNDPHAFVKEIMRVGKKGYIEVPNILAERLFGWDFHLWYCEKKGNELILTAKKEGERFGGFFHRLMNQETGMRRFFEKYESIFYIKYFWNNTIQLRVSKKKKTALQLSNTDDELWKIIRKMDWEFSRNIEFTLQFFTKRIKRKLQKVQRIVLWKTQTLFSPHFVQKLLVSVLLCPVCKKDALYFDEVEYLCMSCYTKFPIKKNIPIFLSKKEQQKGY